MKQIAILGLGRFGRALARTLVEMGHDVMGVDANEAMKAAMGTYGRFDEAVKYIDPREE